MKRPYLYDHLPFVFDFAQTPERFEVEELPSIIPLAKGNYALLLVQKREMSTLQLIDVLAKAAGANRRDVGYAGLKDKHALTCQYITLPRYALRNLARGLRSSRIEILATHYAKKPLRIGELKGNRFRIVLEAMPPEEAKRFEALLPQIANEGFANFFGFQRFGVDQANWQEGKILAHQGGRLRTPAERLRVGVYQSYLFNAWLGARCELSLLSDQGRNDAIAERFGYEKPVIEMLKVQPQRFKLLEGETMRIRGRLHTLPLDEAIEAFRAKTSVPTGLLSGKGVRRARGVAGELEAAFDDRWLDALRGDRRDAWGYATDTQCRYDATHQRMEVRFSLAKGAYATVFLEEIAKRPLKR